ncbi:aminodeoxychorismate synthase component I [Marinobacter bryozoorum]|uniref:aminodeoxychorismate synthase component I n=1 Tax=Marinobacter bryozoorum TaxID=256324 RepID=UPI002002C1B2|nr:aminodeoxychorismate synthase component I [Marinobacter bryozoorum]MCK7544704.1 aminodeoxychorismate synthase component I [Marinobacter bryozoorum]
MSNRVSVPPSRIADFVTALAGLNGFVCLGTGRGRSRRYSALPERRWPLSTDNSVFGQSVTQIIESHRHIAAGTGRSGFVAGTLFYDAGRHTVPGFRSLKPSPESVGWAGLYLWRLEVTRDESLETPATLLFDPACPPAVRSQVMALLDKPRPAVAGNEFRMTTHFHASGTPEQYRRGVGRVLGYIQAGDCYQANLSQQFVGRFEGSPWHAWQALADAIPVPHGGYLDAGPWQLLSVSPELFLEIDDNRVTSKPIKGTRPRSQDPETDQALVRDLVSNTKDRAENLMIVDLIRNDLSHFCQPFSVRVPRLFSVESYRNVHQLVSTVTGTLKPDTTPFEAFLSAFPGGSITGAPKRRAMEIIDELEPHGRGPYCGSLFWWDADNRLESNIAIRSLQTFTDGTIRAWAGCGIVADSDPEDEYQESMSKIQSLLDTLEGLGCPDGETGST